MFQPLLQIAPGDSFSVADGSIIGVLLSGLFVVWRRYQDTIESRHADAITSIKALNEVAGVLKEVTTQAITMAKNIEKLEEQVEMLTKALREARQ